MKLDRKPLGPVYRPHDTVFAMRYALLLSLCALPNTFAQQATPACGRDCLRGMLTRYLDAVLAHDPKQLPLAANVRFTENTVEKPLGEGLWKTAASLGTFRQDILDVRQGVAGTHVVMMENGMPVLYQVRLSWRRERSRKSTRRWSAIRRKA